ncbi:MAG TPA: amidase [Thermomicrobiales bacterium]|nr:amidase [Thermomicrobiales bacterium]
MTARDELELCYASISDVAGMLTRREISAVEITEAVLRRIEHHNDDMRVYITVTADLALAQARGADRDIARGAPLGLLRGIPVALKDNIATRGIRTTCGSAVDPDWVPDEDAAVYSRLREAGATLLGKASLYEYAFSLNDAFPQPPNPWRRDRSSAGSSSGSAVAVATGMAHGAIGSDTGGSGRAPANVNGVVGFKGTFGLVSRRGVVPLSYSLDHVTVFARRVADAALLLQAVSGHDPRDPQSSSVPVPDVRAAIGSDMRGLRVARARGYTHEGIDPDVTRVIDEAFDVLRRLGATIEDVRLPLIEQCSGMQAAIMLPEAAAIHYERLRDAPERLGDSALMRLDLGSVIPATAYINAQQARGVLRDAFRTLFESHDAIVGPANAVRAGEAGAWTTTLDGRTIDLRAVGPEYTGIYNLAGNPAIVIPAGFSSEGTPIGLQIAGRWFDEATVARVAHAFEQATDWHQRRPPV